MKQMGKKRKMMMVLWMVLPSLILTPLKAQEKLLLNLNQALEIALSENPTVKVADQEIEKKQYAKKGSYASLFPQINFGADYSRTLKKQVMYMDMDMGETEIPGMDMSSGIEVGRDNNWTLGFNAAMPLVNVALWKSLSISGLDVELAIEQARSSKIDMVNQVKNSFYAVLLANDSYRVFKNSYDNAMENYVDIKQKYAQGLVAEYDLIRAEVTVRNSEPNMLQAENSLMLAQWQLKALLGMNLDIDIECEGQLSDYERQLYGDYLLTDTSLGENTTLKQLDIQNRQLEQSLKMQKSDYLPTLSLTANYSWMAMNNNFKFGDYKWNPYSTIGVSLSIPIFSGGSRHNKVKQMQVSISQLQYQREDAERNLQLTVKQQMDNMSTNIKQFNAAQKGVEQAERGYEISKKRYDTGAGTLLELNDSELALTQARLNLNQSIYNYMVSKSNLENIIGKQEN